MKKVTILAIATVTALSFGSFAVSAKKKKEGKQPVVFSWNNPYEKLVVPDAPHSAKLIYEKEGRKLMQFHDRNFGR